MDAKGSATPPRRLRDLETWACLFSAEQTQGPSIALGTTEYRDDGVKVKDPRLERPRDVGHTVFTENRVET
jgi:hypothetical protein